MSPQPFHSLKLLEMDILMERKVFDDETDASESPL